MAQLTFTIADGVLTVSGGNRTIQYISTDYRAKSWSNGDRDGVIIFPLAGDANAWASGTYTCKSYSEFALNIEGVAYSPASVEDFVEAFNAACGTNLGFNTQYPQTIISDTIDLDTSVATQLVTALKAGYMTISADEDNSDVVYIGDENVDNDSYQLEPGKSVFVELDDLSKYYAYGAVDNTRISILGAYKY